MVTAWALVGAHEPHHLDVRGGVAEGCGDLGMAEPSLDRQEIDARPEELHGERMPEHVR